MIRTALQSIVEALRPPPPAPVQQSPETIAVQLISDLAPGISVLVFRGTPIEAIRRDVVAEMWPVWARDHGWSVACAAEHFLTGLGPVAFLSADEGRRAGLLPPTPSRGKRR